MSRNAQKVNMGLCIECGCSREEDNNSYWCRPCAKLMQDSHTRRLSENEQ